MPKSTTKKKATPKQDAQAREHSHDHAHDHSHDHAQGPFDAARYIADNQVLKLTLPWANVQPEYQRQLKQLAKRLKLPGFRKGQVPAKLAERKVDAESVISGVLERVTPIFFRTAMAEKKDAPQTLGTPEVRPLSTEKNQDWEVEVHFAIRPEVSIKGYKAAVKKALKEARAQLEKVKKETSAGKDVQKEGEDPKAHQEADEAAEKSSFTEAALRTLIEHSRPEISELLIRERVRRKLSELEQQLKQLQLTIDDFLARRQVPAQQLIEQYQAEALAEWQLEFILEAIRREEKIKADDSAVEAELKKITNLKLREQHGQEPFRSQLKAQLERQQVLDFLIKL